MGYKLDGFQTDVDKDWYSVEDGGDARKIEISIFNLSVPTYYRSKADELLNDFINKHNISDPANDIDSVSGIIAAFIDKNVELDKKYYISVFLYLKENDELQDYTIDFSILPTDKYFAEFKDFIMAELENIIFGE